MRIIFRLVEMASGRAERGKICGLDRILEPEGRSRNRGCGWTHYGIGRDVWKNDWLGTAAPGCPGIMPAEMLTGDREEIQRL